MKALIFAVGLVASTMALAWWSSPLTGSGSGDNDNSAYDGSYGGLGGEQFRGGGAAGGGDLSINLTGRG